MTTEFYTRRRFLRTTLLGGAVAWTLPTFVNQTLLAMEAEARDLVDAPTGKDHPILVILQLAGGNDGLNSIVPFADDAYYRARPKLALPASQVLKVDETSGFHPAMKNLRGLWDEGALAIVRGVGYPNPNRSHFRSTDIWQTASDAHIVERHGWIGRYFDACCSGEDATVGIAISQSEPLAFAGKQRKGLAFRQPADLRSPDASGEDPAMMSGDARDGSSIEDLGKNGQAEGESAADFLQRVALDARLGSDRIHQVTANFRTATAFPASRLGRSLELVARLIAGGLPTRVYYVSQGGYDTHANQAQTHQRLLGELDAALAAFARELQAQKNFDRVLLMTFSEFGRRVQENANGGTDHGAAAPLFLLGGAVRPGWHGKAPDLSRLERGDLIHTTDFRSVYATILDSWMKAPADVILKAPFPKLDLLRV